MANPQQADFQNLTTALQALQAALPNTNNALVNNTNAINNPPQRELRVVNDVGETEIFRPHPIFLAVPK